MSLNAPFNFDRADPAAYSLVELKTLAALGMERLSGWKITAARDKLVPDRLKVQARMKEQELRRLEELRQQQQQKEEEGEVMKQGDTRAGIVV